MVTGWRKFKAFSAMCSPSSRTVEEEAGDWRAWRDPDAAAQASVPGGPHDLPPTPWGGARDSQLEQQPWALGLPGADPLGVGLVLHRPRGG